MPVGAGGIDTRMEARAEARQRERAAERARLRANENSLIGTRSSKPRSGATQPRADQGPVRNSNGVETRTTARVNSQGAANANEQALARANANSALGVAGSTSLVGLSTGTVVESRTGAVLGTITRINRSPDGTVRNVLVQVADGSRRTISLDPGSLTRNGNVIVTTQTNGSRR
jgi:hypothetical protein